ncbi:MAG: hypothetical protein R6W72_13415, partial [Desulfurivibrionaceae bacterium]
MNMVEPRVTETTFKPSDPDPGAPVPAEEAKQQQFSQAYWSLVWWKFKKNKLAIVGAIIIILFYTSCGLFAEFVAPYRLDY